MAVNIPFTFNSTTQRWEASSDNPAIQVTWDTLDRITWTLIVPPGIDPDTLFFNEPAILFPQTQAQAPMVVIVNPQSNNKQCVALWANVDEAKTGLYQYTINATIAGQLVTHDPTVENESPGT